MLRDVFHTISLATFAADQRRLTCADAFLHRRWGTGEGLHIIPHESVMSPAHPDWDGLYFAHGKKRRLFYTGICGIAWKIAWETKKMLKYPCFCTPSLQKR